MGVISNGTTLLDAGALDSGINRCYDIYFTNLLLSFMLLLDFTNGIDDTYDAYVFKFINIHPATVASKFTFQADTGTNTTIIKQ